MKPLSNQDLKIGMDISLDQVHDVAVLTACTLIWLLWNWFTLVIWLWTWQLSAQPRLSKLFIFHPLRFIEGFLLAPIYQTRDIKASKFCTKWGKKCFFNFVKASTFANSKTEPLSSFRHLQITSSLLSCSYFILHHEKWNVMN